ncbi:MAG: response regulator transcription factor [Ignavibacteriae bacterium]|nr:response regulator transcription factor [Ignavibacteriota bacterium]
MTTIRVACVEDNTSLRRRFEEQFTFFSDVELIGTYATGEAAINALQKAAPSQLPNVILMDIELPGMSGIEATIALKELFPEIEIMMFTVFEDELKIFHAIQAGAAGYLLKDDPIEKVVDAIRELSQGGAPMSQSIARTVLSFLRGKSRPAANANSVTAPAVHEPVEFNLSERELELLHGLVHGETYQSLAKKLFISPHTVKTHIKNIYKKLHVHSRALAVRVALDRGLV